MDDDLDESLGLRATDYLSRNDAYPFFNALGDLLKTGPTGTNVNDLLFHSHSNDRSAARKAALLCYSE